MYLTLDGLVRETITSEPNTAYINVMVKTEINKQALQYEDIISFLNGSVDSLTTVVAELRNELNKQQLYSRRASLRIVNDWHEERDEDTDEKVVEMAKSSGLDKLKFWETLKKVASFFSGQPISFG